VEFRQFRYFIAVARELSFTRGAKCLHVSQPPLSRQINALEEELGVRLLNRNKHRVSLTEAGRVFLIHAQDVVERMEAAATMARQVAQGEIGSLVLGYGGVAAYTWVPAILKAFRRQYPAVKVTLDQLPLMDHMDALRSRRIDIGFVLMPFDDRSVSVEPLRRDTLVVAVASDDAVARQSGVRLRQLANRDFVMFPRTRAAAYHRLVTELCRQAGFVPRIAKETAAMESVIGLVASGLGVAIVPSMAQRIHVRDVSFVPLQDKAARIEFAFAWNKDNLSPVVRAFLATARSAARRSAKRA
jgi:DNA-binding transcriptional LysR family regulator